MWTPPSAVLGAKRRSCTQPSGARALQSLAKDGADDEEEDEEEETGPAEGPGLGGAARSRSPRAAADEDLPLAMRKGVVRWK